jgi:hypothetical protein
MTDIDPKTAKEYLDSVTALGRIQRSLDKLTLKTTNLKIRIKNIETDVLLDMYKSIGNSKNDPLPTQEEKEAILWNALKENKIYLDAVEKLRRTERLIINLKFRLAKATSIKVIAETRLK